MLYKIVFLKRLVLRTSTTQCTEDLFQTCNSLRELVYFIWYNRVIFIFRLDRTNLLLKPCGPLSTGLTQSNEIYSSENLKWMVKYYALMVYILLPLFILF